MSQSELNQLAKVEELFDNGRLEEALEILNDETQFEGLNLKQKGYFQFLKGLILLYHNKSEEIINLGEQLFKEGQSRNDDLQSLDGLWFIITGLASADKFDEAFKLINKIESLLHQISNVPEDILTLRKIRISLIKAYVSLHGGKFELVEKSLEWILDLQSKLDKSFEIVWANLIMAEKSARVKMNFDLTMDYIKRALSIAKEIKFNHFWIATIQIFIGVYYGSIGKLDIGVKYHIKALNIFKKIDSIYWIAIVLNNIGNLYGDKGEYELALKYLEESLTLYEQTPYIMFNIATPIDSMITIAFEHEDYGRAQKFFHRLEDLYNHNKENRDLEYLYKYNKALMLKMSSRIRDKAQAEELLKEVVETATIYFDIHIKAHIHLCDLLLMEYRIDNNSDISNELDHYIHKLLNIAENQHSYLVFCETFILQAKLALVNFDIKSARRFLTQAQKIAESNGLKRLAMKISYEHDELLKQLSIWEKLKKSKASFSERWDLAGLNKQIEHMISKRMIEVPELLEEEPVFLLIVSEGGMPFFSQSFIGDKTFEDHLFGGFFTTLNSFINEKFSEGLDRASFGDHTLLMSVVSPFLMCYVYKGQSYSAQNRINLFINELKGNREIWDTFEKFYKVNRKVQMNDIPSLEPLIREIFIEKTIN